jgi:hypothetical protein
MLIMQRRYITCIAYIHEYISMDEKYVNMTCASYIPMSVSGFSLYDREFLLI